MTAEESDPGKQFSVWTLWAQHSRKTLRGGLPCHLQSLMSQKNKSIKFFQWKEKQVIVDGSGLRVPAREVCVFGEVGVGT